MAQNEKELILLNSQQKRLKTAGFPQYKYLEDLDRNELPEGVKPRLAELESLDFVRQGHNVVLYGNPGTGKTHLAIGLGIEACKNRMSVMFTSVPHLITQIKECRSQRTLHALETRFKRYDLVICDEFGYMACDKEGGELLFNHLSLRTDTKSTIITTNLSFDRWGEIIKDKILVNALVDRLTHNAYLINMNGESYRLKETKKFNQKITRKRWKIKCIYYLCNRDLKGGHFYISKGVTSQLAHALHHVAVAFYLLLCGKTLIEDEVVITLESMTINAGILVAMACDELLQIDRSMGQVLDMERHILDETRRTDWPLTAHSREDTGADRPVLSIDLRGIGKGGLAIEVKSRERVHDLLDICLQSFRRQGLGLGEDSREIMVVAFGYAVNTTCIHILLIVQIDGVVDTLQRQIVEHLRTLYLEILIGHRHVVLVGFQLFQSDDGLAALLHGLEINHSRSAVRIFVQRFHADTGEEGQRPLRAHDTVCDDVEGIVVVDKRTDVETRDVLDRILISDALGEVCVLPDLIAQALNLLEKLGMTLAEGLAALLVTGIEDGAISKNEAGAEQHVVAVGMYATVHARGVVDHDTADHSTAHRGRVGWEHTPIRLQNLFHTSSRDTGLKGDGILVII